MTNGWLAAFGSFWMLLAVAVAAQTSPDYDVLVQKGKTQLQAGSTDLALASGEAAIKVNADRWEAYALAGGALMNLKQYEAAVDKFSKAIEKAPEAKQVALRDLRRQCLSAESGSPAPKEASAATTSQAEIVLWKSIENTTNPADFQSYLDQYPKGAFVALAQRHLTEAKGRANREQEQQKRLVWAWEDPATRLIWARHDNGGPVSWNQANDYCANLHLLDYSGWRLPTLEELKDIHVNQPEQIKGGLQPTPLRSHDGSFRVRLWTSDQKGSRDAMVAYFGGGGFSEFGWHVNKSEANALCVHSPE